MLEDAAKTRTPRNANDLQNPPNIIIKAPSGPSMVYEHGASPIDLVGFLSSD